MNHNVKGQMVFEFVVAAVIFFGIIFYTINYLNSSVSVFSSELYMNNLETKAIQISELLVHNPGIWEGNKPRIVGLSKKWPVLDMTKVDRLDVFCNGSEGNYDYLLKNLDLEESRFGSTQMYSMKIRINENGNALLDCGPNPPERRMVNVERFALSSDNEILRINVWLW